MNALRDSTSLQMSFHVLHVQQVRFRLAEPFHAPHVNLESSPWEMPAPARNAAQESSLLWVQATATNALQDSTSLQMVFHVLHAQQARFRPVEPCHAQLVKLASTPHRGQVPAPNAPVGNTFL